MNFHQDESALRGATYKQFLACLEVIIEHHKERKNHLARLLREGCGPPLEDACHTHQAVRILLHKNLLIGELGRLLNQRDELLEGGAEDREWEDFLLRQFGEELTVSKTILLLRILLDEGVVVGNLVLRNLVKDFQVIVAEQVHLLKDDRILA